jgi:hypothetical protein
MEGIGAARPSLPEALNDREQDNWELLLAIADHCGGDWPGIARNAAVSLSGAKDDTAPLGGQLLDDVQEIVNTSAQEHGVYSQVLLDRLLGMSERPWGECNRGKPLTLNRLAKMLVAFGLKTKSLKIAGVVQRGCGIAELQAAFARYCTPNTARATETLFQSATVLLVNEINGLDANQSATENFGNHEVLPNFTVKNQFVNHDGSTVALQTPQSGGESESSGAVDAQSLAEQGLAAAKRGHDWLSAFWAELTPDERKAVGGQDALMAWKFIAARARPSQG